MSDSVASQERISESPTGSNPIEPWSVEQDADRLMDDLFSDLDRMLDGGTSLPTETVQPEYSTPQSSAIPPLAILTAPGSPPMELPTAQLSPPPEETRQEKMIRRPKAKVEPPQKKRGVAQQADKILFGVACLTLIGVVVWLFAQGKLNFKQLLERFSPQAGVETSLATNRVEPLSESDAQFINYMLRSLELIDRKATTRNAQTASGGQSALPPAPGTSNAGSNIAPSAIERVYIPVPIYPAIQSPGAGLLPPPAAQSSPPNSPAPQTQPKTAAPDPKPPAQAESAPAPRTAPQSSAPAPSPAPAPVAAAPAPPPANHVLAGLIVGSDGNAAALFKIEGATQRIRAGEAIGNSGWVLYSIGNQTALIRRNGEVREIYVGQKF